MNGLSPNGDRLTHEHDTDTIAPTLASPTYTGYALELFSNLVSLLATCTGHEYMLKMSINYVKIEESIMSVIEKSVPRIAIWHNEACRVMSNGDSAGQIFLSYPHTNNGFFFLLTTVF